LWVVLVTNVSHSAWLNVARAAAWIGLAAAGIGGMAAAPSSCVPSLMMHSHSTAVMKRR
jgi:hypothetical protein